jgi:hypothetical protein
MPSVAEVLLRAMTISDDEQRRSFLVDNPVIVRRHGMVHRVAGYERRSATWMTFCGVSYEGNAYEDDVGEGEIDCMTCLVARR